MKCPMTGPGLCGACGRMARWADIQTCRLGGTDPPASCLACTHASAPLTNAAGDIIGQSDCGCGGRATGQNVGDMWADEKSRFGGQGNPMP